jgi:hypothetical protein
MEENEFAWASGHSGPDKTNGTVGEKYQQYQRLIILQEKARLRHGTSANVVK